VSKYHLLRTFEREHGMTPHTYQVQLRLALAVALLAAGAPVSRAAYDAGFTDQSHLTRRFKEYVGLTPGAFARLFRALRGGTCAGRPAPTPAAAA
jgi:AraC-like DNA-binding protein